MQVNINKIIPIKLASLIKQIPPIVKHTIINIKTQKIIYGKRLFKDFSLLKALAYINSPSKSNTPSIAVML